MGIMDTHSTLQSSAGSEEQLQVVCMEEGCVWCVECVYGRGMCVVCSVYGRGMWVVCGVCVCFV